MSSRGEYEVEDILGEKKKGSKILYDVKWKGYQVRTWEPAQNLGSCTDILMAYKQRKAEEGNKSTPASPNKSKQKKRRRIDSSPRMKRGRPRSSTKTQIQLDEDRKKSGEAKSSHKKELKESKFPDKIDSFVQYTGSRIRELANTDRMEVMHKIDTLLYEYEA